MPEPRPPAILRPKLFSKRLSSFPWLLCGMTARDFEPDAPGRLAQAARLPTLLGMDGASLVAGEQVHGGETARVGPEEKARAGGGVLEIPGVDGLLTDETGVVLSIFTADCAPVVLADARTRAIAAVHAGREGTRRRIVPKAVARLVESGSRPEDLFAWIGPSICASHYEVSEAIAAEFRDLFGRFCDVVRGPGNRCLALAEINRCELLEAGLPPENVELDTRCTFEEAELFHSYRRDGARAGRMITFVARVT